MSIMVNIHRNENHTINCDDNQDCIISCEDYNHSCFNTIIHCPSTDNCYIKCKSGPSNNICQNIQITCPKNGNWHISSTSDSVCKHASINDNTCTGNNTCETTTIDTKYSNNFLLECGIGGENTCGSLNIQFPPNINNTMTNKKSTIIAADLFLSIPILFDAINGWIDVNIINYIGSYSELSCRFKSNAFECANINDSCHNPFKIEQTYLKTLPPTTSIKNDNVETDELLYVTKFFQSTIANSNNSNNNFSLSKIQTAFTNATNALLPNTTNLITVHSISKSSINKLVDSPVTLVSNNSNTNHSNKLQNIDSATPQSSSPKTISYDQNNS